MYYVHVQVEDGPIQNINTDLMIWDQPGIKPNYNLGGAPLTADTVQEFIDGMLAVYTQILSYELTDSDDECSVFVLNGFLPATPGKPMTTIWFDLNPNPTEQPDAN